MEKCNRLLVNLKNAIDDMRELDNILKELLKLDEKHFDTKIQSDDAIKSNIHIENQDLTFNYQGECT